MSNLEQTQFVHSPVTGISPSHLGLALDFFTGNGILVSDFLCTLFAFVPATHSDAHTRTIQDIEKNIGSILHTMFGQPSLGGSVLRWVHGTATAAYKQEIRSLTGADSGLHFNATRSRADQFSEFDTVTVMNRIASRAPLLWDLCNQLYCTEGTQPFAVITDVKEQFERDVKKFACISSIVHANNQKSNLLQVIAGIFLHTCNTSERAIDFFHTIGVCCSQKTILLAIDSLSKESVKHITRAGQTMVVGYAYDNFDMTDKSKTPVVEHSSDTLRHLTSGTLLPLQFTHIDDLRGATEYWNVSRFNDTKTGNIPRRSIHDLFLLHPETPDEHGLGQRDRFVAWQFLKDLCSYGPEYFRQFQSKILPPPYVDKVPLFKTRQVPARAMDLANSTVDGNIQTIESLLRQGGVFDIDELKRYHPDISQPEDFFILFHGDLGSGERIQTAQTRRSLESTPRLRLQNIVFVPGLLHMKMACADAISRLLLQPSGARSDGNSFFSCLTILRPRETGKLANGTAGYQILNECIVHVGRADRLGWWESIIRERHTKCNTLEDFSVLKPSFRKLEDLAAALATIVSRKNIQSMKALSNANRDHWYENMIQRSVYFLLYEETAHAIRSGDVGRVETCFRGWIPIFKSVGKHKYAAMLLQFLTDVHFVYPVPLRKSIRYNWFCNISGKEMKFQGNDWLVELNNMLTKGIYGGHGANNTVDRVLKESVLIQLFRDVIAIVETQFGIRSKLTRHGDPDMSATYTELRRHMHENNAFVKKDGRRSAFQLIDAFEDGMLKFATETILQSMDTLAGSNEVEQVATEEDIIMEAI